MNKDIKTRDEIIFGEYDPEKYKYGGIRRFERSPDVIHRLIENDFIDLNECQNSSPSTKEFMEYVEDIEEYVTFGGYAVVDTRHDYRVTIDEIQILLPVEKQDEFFSLIEIFRYADEFSVSRDVDNYYLHAWWD